MKLLTKWTDFEKEIIFFISEGEAIFSQKNDIKNEIELTTIKEKISAWKKKCIDYLKSSVDESSVVNSFNQKSTPNIRTQGHQITISQLINNEFNELQSKINNLKFFLRIFSVFDVFVEPEKTNLEIRMNYSTEEIMDLLLDKLFDLYDDKFYSVGFILAGNGIELKRNNDDREIAKYLENLGYIKCVHTSITVAQLTTDGKIYVENKRKISKTSYEGLGDSKEEISKNIDEIIERLEKLGYGQEVLFNELEELKELYGQINKKNWGQLLKGKLIDLGLSQIISKDTMKLIYESLTNEILKLT
jgi:hypothetical protein